MRQIQKLTPREREILELRLGLRDETPLSLAEVGDKLGITRERVRQLEDRALRRLCILREEPKADTLKKIPAFGRPIEVGSN